MSKREKLALIEGYESFFDLLCVYEDEEIVPGICVNQGCDFTKSVNFLSNEECDACKTDSVQSLHMLIARNIN